VKVGDPSTYCLTYVPSICNASYGELKKHCLLYATTKNLSLLSITEGLATNLKQLTDSCQAIAILDENAVVFGHGAQIALVVKMGTPQLLKWHDTTINYLNYIAEKKIVISGSTDGVVRLCQYNGSAITACLAKLSGFMNYMQRSVNSSNGLVAALINDGDIKFYELDVE